MFSFSHYRPSTPPTYKFFDYINGYPHTTRIHAKERELHWNKTFVKAGELTPTTVHTTTTFNPDRTYSIRSEVTTEQGTEPLFTWYYPKYDNHSSIPNPYDQQPLPPSPTPKLIFLPPSTQEERDIWTRTIPPRTRTVGEHPRSTTYTARKDKWSRRAGKHTLPSELPLRV